MPPRLFLAPLVCLLALHAPVPAAAPAAPTAPPAATPGEAYSRVAAAYMNGDWDALDKELRAAKDPAGFTAAQQADLAYVRQTASECHPAWWAACKTGRPTPLRPVIFDNTLNIIYSPREAEGIQMGGGSGPAVALAWNPANMDSLAPAEYGFLKGDLASVSIWHTLGRAAALTTGPRTGWAVANEKDNLRLNLYLDFRGNVTALYYASPPARRWALHIDLAAYLPEFGKGPLAMSRKVMAAMFLTEVLKTPAQYPSLALPQTLAAESAEEKLAVFYKFNRTARNKAWTLAEDRTFREALKAFAAANDQEVKKTAKVTLPNGLTFAMLADDDAGPRAQRDAWCKSQFEAGKGK